MIIKKLNTTHVNRILAEKNLRLFADIGASGVWCSRGVNYSTNDLPISSNLKELINVWQRDYDRNFSRDTEENKLDMEIHREYNKIIINMLREELPGWVIT